MQQSKPWPENRRAGGGGAETSPPLVPHRLLFAFRQASARAWSPLYICTTGRPVPRQSGHLQEPAVTLAMLLMFAPSFHKVLQRHHSGHPDSSFMQCYEMLIRSCFPKSCSTTLQRRGGEEEVGRKKERKKERVQKDTLTFSEPLAAHFCYLIKGEDEVHGHGNNRAGAPFGKKRECKVHNCRTCALMSASF